VKTVHVIQHTSAEYLGLIEDHLEGRGVRFRYWRPFATDGALPLAATLRDGLVLLGGGPWGSAGTRDLPTLAAEIGLARACLDRGWPLVGIGLGAQIVSLAAGGASATAPLQFSLVRAGRDSATALGGYLPETFPVALYGRDRALLPPQARVLARGEDGGALAWQCGPRAFGFAGHPGIKAAMIEDLVMEFEEAPEPVGPALSQLRTAQREIEDALVGIMAGLVQAAGWMEPATGLRAIPVRRA
jgi:GMP synthase-like glutamine amidotransferase